MSRSERPLEMELAPLEHPAAVLLELQDENLRGPSANAAFAFVFLLVILLAVVLQNANSFLSSRDAAIGFGITIGATGAASASYGIIRARQEKGVEERNKLRRERREEIAKFAPELSIETPLFVTHNFNELSPIFLTAEILTESLRDNISTNGLVAVLNNIFTNKPTDRSLLKPESIGRIEETTESLRIIDCPPFGRTENKRLIQFIFNSCLLGFLKHHSELLPEVSRDELTEKYKSFRINFLRGCEENYPEALVEERVKNLLIPLSSAFIAEGKIDDVAMALREYRDGHLEIRATESPGLSARTARRLSSDEHDRGL